MRIALAGLATFVALAALAREAAAQDPSDAIYDESAVKSFYLNFADLNDWTDICNDGAGAGDVWKRADMTWVGETVLGVGVKRSGKGTLTMVTPKPSIRISFNEFEFANPAGPGTPGRKWRGVNRIKLDSMIGNTDPAMMRDRVAYGLFRAAGAPAPRACHGRLYVNNVFKGLYTVEEPVRKDFARYRWGEDGGNLYNQDGWGSDAYNWRGTGQGSYVPDPFTAETNYPGGDYSDLVTLMDIVNNGGAQIRTRLDGHINLDGFLRHNALATIIADNDDISHWGGGWCNNHLWYHRAGTNRIEIIKWDPGASQGIHYPDPQTPIGYRYENVKMTAWNKSDSTAWATLRSKIAQILDGPAASIQSRIDTIWTQTQTHAYADPLKGQHRNDPNGFNNGEIDAGVAWLKNYWNQRIAYLRSQVGSSAINDAQYVSQNVPASMTPGQTVTVTVTMRNTGTTTWTDANGYRLGSQNPMDNTTWGSDRISMPAGSSIAPGQQVAFSWTVTAPAAGTYNFQWQMRQSGVEWFGPLTPNVAVTVSSTPPPPPPPPSATNDAQFVSQNVPASMVAGQTYSVTVTMRNTGTSTWIDDPTTPYRLGSQNLQDNTTWGSNRISMAAGSSIAPNQQVSFSWSVTAPAAGTYNFQWQMRQSGVEWFGPLTPNVAVTVSATPPPPPPPTTSGNSAQFVSQTVPAAMQPGLTYTVSVTMRNTGTTTWIDDPTNPYRLGSQNPQDNMTWGMNRVSLLAGASIAPGQDGTYTWDVTAPATEGNYAFQWQMRQSGVEWFGELTANFLVSVSATAPPPPVPANTDRSGSGGGCGATGFEGALLALLGLVLRRRRA